MQAEWYCRIMGEEWGPMSAMELIAVARWGRLSRDDLVRRGEGGTWVRAELVKGLFNLPPVAATVTSDRLVAAAKKVAPAKRSVSKGAPTAYWLKTGEKVSGPFTSSELRQMAEQGALKRDFLISRDKQHWAPADRVKGLRFADADANGRTMTIRSVDLQNSHHPLTKTASAEYLADSSALT